jgi:hypothetical protein
VPSNSLYEIARDKIKNALAQTTPRNALVDAARGALMGVSTDVLGYPVDLATMAMRPFGYNVEKPVGGSDWLAENLTSPTDSLAENAGRFATGMLTPGPQEMLRLAGIGRNPLVSELTVYHGSPHRINNVDEANPVGKFDLSKVGTGEGAQAYGHGVYLAENPAVAREYAGALSSARANQPVGRVDLTEAYQHLPGDVPDSVISARGDFRELRDAGVLDPSDRRDFLQAVRNNIDAGKGGNFYTVDLPDEHIAKMLDWDAPLSEQSPQVTAALRDLTDSVQGSGFFDEWLKAGGGDYRDLWGNVLGERMDSSQISAELRKRGIPGIRYLDGGSRGDGAPTGGQGTRNFVIFDGDTAKILKRE